MEYPWFFQVYRLNLFRQELKRETGCRSRFESDLFVEWMTGGSDIGHQEVRRPRDRAIFSGSNRIDSIQNASVVFDLDEPGRLCRYEYVRFFVESFGALFYSVRRCEQEEGRHLS